MLNLILMALCFLQGFVLLLEVFSKMIVGCAYVVFQYRLEKV
ncbi:hypothetical protein Golob_019275 [Gossypium lobatum]|uniref:Uncharacterized protein n=1 Tax=Gossypium lobatum TaxID=34289 RepID=A0A7J8L6W3_9ROSI|nr:hypothetical protein [Gossypium lobatum]